MVFSRQSFGSRDDTSKCCISTGPNIFSTDPHYQKDTVKYSKDIWSIFLIVSFVLGICSLLLFWVPIIGIIIAIVSFTFSIFGLKSFIKRIIVYFAIVLNVLSIIINLISFII